jgi:hypothetical protein
MFPNVAVVTPAALHAEKIGSTTVVGTIGLPLYCASAGSAQTRAAIERLSFLT